MKWLTADGPAVLIVPVLMLAGPPLAYALVARSAAAALLALILALAWVFGAAPFLPRLLSWREQRAEADARNLAGYAPRRSGD